MVPDVTGFAGPLKAAAATKTAAPAVPLTGDELTILGRNTIQRLGRYRQVTPLRGGVVGGATGAIGGALYGATTGDDRDSRLRRAMAGGLVGAGIGALAGASVGYEVRHLHDKYIDDVVRLHAQRHGAFVPTAPAEQLEHLQAVGHLPPHATVADITPQHLDTLQTMYDDYNKANAHRIRSMLSGKPDDSMIATGDPERYHRELGEAIQALEAT